MRQFLSFFFLILVVIFFFPSFAEGSLIDEINRQIQEAEQKRLELEKKAQEYKKTINQKRKEIKTLNNQIAFYEAKINQLQTEINLTENKIYRTKLEIIRLEYGVEQTEKDIDKQKEVLSETIRLINQYDQNTELEIILQCENLSDFFNQLNYVHYLQKQVKQGIENLKYLKKQLEENKTSQEKEKEKLEDLKKQLKQQQNSLKYQKDSKRALLLRTKGEEKKYQQLLANLEAQKRLILGDINRLRQLKAVELARLKKLQEKPPKEYWASLNWYYRQDDPRWSKTTIGFTESTLADYGCAISSVAMVFTYYGETITPAQLAKKPIFYYDLIEWPKSYGRVKLILNTAHRGVDWIRIDQEIARGRPVIVFIRANGRQAGHYVVIHHKTKEGRYVVHDPLFGPNIYLESTQVYISNLYNTTTSLDQMVVYRK